MSENKTSKYFKYALGEIILVVIGILIALQINNWNEKRLKQDELTKIYERLILDIDNDIFDLSVSTKYWMDKQPVFNSIVNDSISVELLDKGISRLLASNGMTNLNIAGINQLKSLNIRSELALEIIGIYDSMENITILPTEKKILDESSKLTFKIRGNYSWFGEWISKTINKDNSSKALQDYFLTSQDYKNRVHYFNQLIFSNYVPTLKYYTKELESARTDLKLLVDKDCKSVSKNELQKYTGNYKVTENKNDILGFNKDDVFHITAHDGFIRVSSISDRLNFVDYYMRKDNSFFADMDFGKSTIIFNEDADFKVNSLEESTKTSKTKTQLKAVKVETNNKK